MIDENKLMKPNESDNLEQIIDRQTKRLEELNDATILIKGISNLLCTYIKLNELQQVNIYYQFIIVLRSAFLLGFYHLFVKLDDKSCTILASIFYFINCVTLLLFCKHRFN